MLQSLRNRRNRKGFTLAELLIVVAIIAVLVAIAVPIFVSALDKAEKAVIDANERTLKGMVVTEILSSDDLLYYTADGKSVHDTTWYATGTYNKETDEFTLNKKDITPSKGGAVENPNKGKESVKTDANTYTLYVTVTYSEVTE